MRLLCITSHADSLNSVRPEAELFIGLATRGVQVSVMTQADSVYAQHMRDAGIRIIDFVPRRKLSAAAIRYIRSVLRDGCFDVVYGFNNRAITNTNFAALGLPVKVVTYRGQTGNIHRFDPTAYLTHLNPRVDKIICVANAVRDSLRAGHCRPERVVTVYKGHDLEWYCQPAADLEPFGIPRTAFVAGCVSNNRPRKGLPVLIEATRRLADLDNLYLLLIGSGLDDRQLKRAIAASPMCERIFSVGYRTDAPALIHACDVSVLPSVKREGLPKTVIESMAYGIAPIVTDSGGSPELVENGISGIVVPAADSGAIADAIRRLYEAPQTCKEMGRCARERIRTHFDIRDSVERTLRILEDLTH